MSSNYKIAFNASALVNQPSGVGEFALEILKELILLCQKQNIKTYLFGPKFCKYLSIDSPNVVFKEIPDFTNKSLSRIIWNQFDYSKELKKISDNNSDLISYSVSAYGFASFNIFTKTKQNIRQYIVIHDLINIIAPQQYPKQTKYFKWWVPKLINNCHQVLTVSEHSKNDLIKYYSLDNSKVTSVYNGIDKKIYNNQALKYNSKINLDENYFIIPGVTYPHKNVSRIIKVFDQLLKIKDDLPNLTCSKFKLYITGSNSDYMNKLKELVDILNINNDVKFLGYVSKYDLAYLYANAKFMVYPSLYEGFGMPPLEAMACGCPTLVSNKSSLPEVCGDATVYINPESDEDIINKIKELCFDTLLRKNLKEKGHERTKNFSWTKAAKETFEIITQNN